MYLFNLMINLGDLSTSVHEELCDLLIQIHCHFPDQFPPLGEFQSFTLANDAEPNNPAHQSFCAWASTSVG